MNFLPRIYGQEKIQKTLNYMVSNNTLGHTLIFYGDEGLGKTTAAIDLASILMKKENLYQKETEKWFKEDFSKFPVLTTSDKQLWYIRPLGMELKLEQFRVFLESMQTFDDKIHVCIIDEAQSMMSPVANALLKTLEEPLKNIYFILITHELNTLLPTIISRGQLFPFFSLNQQEYFELIRKNTDKFELPDGVDYKQAFRLTEGNPGLTLSFFEDGNFIFLKRAFKFWETVSTNKNFFYLLSQEEFKDRVDFIRYIKFLRVIGQDLMLLIATGNIDFVRCINFVELEKTISQKWTYEKVYYSLKILEKALTACKRYISLKLIWDMIIIEFEHIQKGDKGWKV